MLLFQLPCAWYSVHAASRAAVGAAPKLSRANCCPRLQDAGTSARALLAVAPKLPSRVARGGRDPSKHHAIAQSISAHRREHRIAPRFHAHGAWRATRVEPGCLDAAAADAALRALAVIHGEPSEAAAVLRDVVLTPDVTVPTASVFAATPGRGPPSARLLQSAEQRERDRANAAESGPSLFNWIMDCPPEKNDRHQMASQGKMEQAQVDADQTADGGHHLVFCVRSRGSWPFLFPQQVGGFPRPSASGIN